MKKQTKLTPLTTAITVAALTLFFTAPGTLRAGNPTPADLDGDGIPNIVDPDVDNDGIPNGLDRNVDGGKAKSGPFAGTHIGDHLRNTNPLELDIDGDGLNDDALDEEDIDGDGLNDDASDELDIDGDQRPDDRSRSSLRITFFTNIGINESGACTTCARMRDCAGNAPIHIAIRAAVRAPERAVAITVLSSR